MFKALVRQLGRLRRWTSRSESMVRWFGLSRSVGTAEEPGIVLIQIDGLSRAQLEKAIANRRMPFLRKLLRKGGYQLNSMYSGLPSTTPAVQGEIFYGVKCAVPAFAYFEPLHREMVRMFDSAPAAKVEAAMAKKSRGLLAGGSAYSNIYAGGAAEPHLCASTSGWGDMLQGTNLVTWGGIVLWNIWSIVRMITLMFVEFGVALVDVATGKKAKRDLRIELKFIFSRVAVSIGMRELITIGASMDVTRGLPIVQFNFLGYDEQSHRRGPSSKFAHWSLKGIDDAIKRVAVAARRSSRRRYSLWIYSDHGQEKTIPYMHKFGRSVQEAVAEVLGQHITAESKRSEPSGKGTQSSRMQWFDGKAGRAAARSLLPVPPDDGREKSPNETPAGQPPGLEVASLGPIGHVYPSTELDAETLQKMAPALVERAGIPLVLAAAGPNEATAWTPRGKFMLPDEAEAVLGEHPFLSEAASDLVCLCHHEHAGTLIIGGWSVGETALTFADENGAHAGPGKEETHAFMLLPPEVELSTPQRGFLRPDDLRCAALRALGRDEEISADGERRTGETPALIVAQPN